MYNCLSLKCGCMCRSLTSFSLPSLSLAHKCTHAHTDHSVTDGYLSCLASAPDISLTLSVHVPVSSSFNFCVSFVINMIYCAQKYYIYHTYEGDSEPASEVATQTSHELVGLYACHRYFTWVRPAFETCPFTGVKDFYTEEGMWKLSGILNLWSMVVKERLFHSLVLDVK